jgi:hypothetical protein
MLLLYVAFPASQAWHLVLPRSLDQPEGHTKHESNFIVELRYFPGTHNSHVPFMLVPIASPASHLFAHFALPGSELSPKPQETQLVAFELTVNVFLGQFRHDEVPGAC